MDNRTLFKLDHLEEVLKRGFENVDSGYITETEFDEAMLVIKTVLEDSNSTIDSELTSFRKTLEDFSANLGTLGGNDATIRTELYALRNDLLDKIAKVKALKGDQGEAGKNGKDGQDSDPEIVAGILKQDPIFVGSLKGNDGSPDTSEDIRNKLELLMGDERLELSAIKGSEVLLKKIEDSYKRQNMPLPASIRIRAYDNGKLLNGPLGSINFVGATVTQTGEDVTVNVSGGSGTITGTGTSPRMTYWTGTSAIAAMANFSYTAPTVGGDSVVFNGVDAAGKFSGANIAFNVTSDILVTDVPINIYSVALDTNIFYVDRTGTGYFRNKLGVGASAINPSRTLHVYDSSLFGSAAPDASAFVDMVNFSGGPTYTLRLSGGTNPAMALRSNATNNVTVKLQALDVGSSLFGTESNHPIDVYTSNSARMRVIGAGAMNFGSAATPYAQYDFELAGGTTKGNIGSNYGFRILSGGLNNIFVVKADTGNIGFTELNPASKLSVGGGASIGASYSATAAPSNGMIVQGNVGLGQTSATAKLNIAAGSATANTAPLKFTSGALLTTAEAGAVEFLTDTYYATVTTGAKRNAIATVNTGRSTAQTGAVASVLAYTLPAVDGSFEVSANVLVTTATSHNFTVTCAYTDEGNTARTLTLNFTNVGGTIATAVSNIGGAVPYMGIPTVIRCKASTAITIATTGTFTTVTYNVEGFITRLS